MGKAKIPKFKWFVWKDSDPETGGVKSYNGKRYTYYWITPVEYYVQNGCISDSHLTRKLPEEAVRIMAEDMESHFEFHGTPSSLMDILAPLGFVYMGEWNG